MSGKRIVVREGAHRLDVWLCEQFPGVSRRRARQLCEAGEVFVNGYPCRAGAYLNEGSVVEIRGTVEPARARELAAEVETDGVRRKPRTVFEDEFLIALSKPRGIATVTLRADDPETLADILVTSGAAQRDVSPDPREAGLLQRLDFWTSGLLLAAKTRAVWERLRKELFDGQVRKSYLAVIEGCPKKPHFLVESPLRPSADGKQMQIAPIDFPGALSARTEVELCDSFEKPFPFAVVRVQANRARRHQVRTHLASKGHVLVGDALYGSKRLLLALPNEVAERVEEPGEGFLLHAERISFKHPVTQREMNLIDRPAWADFFPGC